MKTSHKAALIVLIVNVLLLIALGVSWLSYTGLSNTLTAQQEGERFGGKGFAQVSAFFPTGSGINFTQIKSMRLSIEDKLAKQSVEALNPDAPLYLDAFSARVNALTVTGLRGNTTANTVAIGGDFFRFHPYKLLDGTYLYSDDLEHDRIVIDDRAAWFLFGSNNVAGMYVTIGGNSYKIAGVVRFEADAESETAYKASFNNSNPCIFVPYEMLETTDSPVTFTTYEFVSQNLFTTYLSNLLSEESTLSAAEVKMNTGRFTIAKAYDVLVNFGSRSMQTKGMSYPYWENAARLVENKLAILLVVLIALAVIPVLSFLFLMGWLLKSTKGKGKVVAVFFGDRLDFVYRWRWRRQNAKAAKAAAATPLLEAPIPGHDPENTDAEAD